MTRIPTRFTSLLLASLLALPAQAADTLAFAVDAAWQRSISASAALGEQRTAEALAASAGRWWAEPPAVALSHRNDRWQNDLGKQEYGLDLSVPLWLPGQRSAQIHAATAGLAQAEAVQRAARWRIAGEVRERAWQLAALQAELTQMDAALEYLRRLSADVRRRVDAGELPRTDLLAAQAEEVSARSRRAGADLQLREASLHWQNLTGLERHLPITALTESQPAAISSTLSEEHPALRESAGEMASMAAQRDLARASRSAAPELSLGWRRDVDGRGIAPQNSIVIGVKLPLGTDDRNKPLQARAEAALDLARTREQRQREEAAGRLVLARDTLSLAQVQAAAAQDQARLLRERSRLLERAFSAGELALAELLRALAAASEAEAGATRQQAQLGLAQARLLQSLGQVP